MSFQVVVVVVELKTTKKKKWLEQQQQQHTHILDKLRHEANQPADSLKINDVQQTVNLAQVVAAAACLVLVN